MSTSLGERVAEQAQLLVDLLHMLAPEVDDPSDLPAPSAAIVARMFHGLEILHEAVGVVRGGPVAASDAPVDPQQRHREYPGMIDRIRSRVASVVPADSIVAVVTRGDAALLELAGLEAWHYPQNVLGVWAGFHPASGRDAVDHLVELRGRGASHLVIPATSRWWLDFYEELRAHLASEARIIVNDDDLSLFELIVPRSASVADPARGGYDRQIQAFVELADALVPPGETIVVVTRGDDAWLRSRHAVARHFPADRSGVYAGHPDGDHGAVEALELAREQGARYLAIPAPMRWWERAYPLFTDHLHREHRPVADRAEVGVIFELNPLRVG